MEEKEEGLLLFFGFLEKMAWPARMDNGRMVDGRTASTDITRTCCPVLCNEKKRTTYKIRANVQVPPSHFGDRDAVIHHNHNSK